MRENAETVHIKHAHTQQESEIKKSNEKTRRTGSQPLVCNEIAF